MKAFAGFKSYIWCMDLAYVDKRANDNICVKYLLVCEDLFDGVVTAKVMKTRDSREAVRAILITITKKNRPKKIGSRREGSLQEFF